MSGQRRERFWKNAPGPFYALAGECMFCGAPEAEAPALLAPLEGGNRDTYFVRQPSTPEEVEQACRALEVCCVGALRYGGTDPAILRRLGNDPEYCDHVLPGGPVPRPDWYTDDRAAQPSQAGSRRRRFRLRWPWRRG